MFVSFVTKMNGTPAVFHVDEHAASSEFSVARNIQLVSPRCNAAREVSPRFHGFFQPAPVFKQTIFSCGL